MIRLFGRRFDGCIATTKFESDVVVVWRTEPRHAVDRDTAAFAQFLISKNEILRCSEQMLRSHYLKMVCNGIWLSLLFLALSNNAFHLPQMIGYAPQLFHDFWSAVFGSVCVGDGLSS